MFQLAPLVVVVVVLVNVEAHDSSAECSPSTPPPRSIQPGVAAQRRQQLRQRQRIVSAALFPRRFWLRFSVMKQTLLGPAAQHGRQRERM